MNPEELDKAFREAVESINQHQEPFPADVLLRLYAYYKRATNNAHEPSGKAYICLQDQCPFPNPRPVKR